MSMQAMSRSIASPKSALAAGIGLMLLGCFVFSLNDALGKWLVATYSVGELLLIRSAAALCVLAPLAYREGFAVFAAMLRPRLQLLRVALSSLEVGFFFWAVSYLPLADVTTFYLAGPIFVTALSPFLLGETIGWKRCAAVIMGFAGVVIAMRPSSAVFGMPSLIALGGSILFALQMMVTRSLRGTRDIVLATTQIASTFVLGVLTAPFGWVTPGARDLGLFALLGVVAIFGLFCVNRSLKLAPASVVVPYQYSFILWAMILGYFVFGDVPGALLVLGAAIIVGAGIFIFWRENAATGSDEALPPVA
ncbi:MAG TPA: DMT family transporter [Xanthobacteraceae bacterium]|nr:DMT family transporter [Xanthobacteraceae bacterium]